MDLELGIGDQRVQGLRGSARLHVLDVVERAGDVGADRGLGTSFLKVEDLRHVLGGYAVPSDLSELIVHSFGESVDPAVLHDDALLEKWHQLGLEPPPAFLELFPPGFRLEHGVGDVALHLDALGGGEANVVVDVGGLLRPPVAGLLYYPVQLPLVVLVLFVGVYAEYLAVALF